jgi:hypothetical protein
LTVKVSEPVEELEVAVTVTTVSAATATVVTLNVAVVDPDGTVTIAGTVTDGELDASVTTYPGGAALVRVIVPVVPVPPTNDVAITFRVFIVGSVTVKSAETVVWPFPALIVATCVVGSFVVVAVNVALVAPAAIVTDAGTVAAELFELRLTVNAPTVLPVSVTVPVEDTPPATVDGFITTVLMIGGNTFRSTDSVTPQAVAVK